ncbi:MAG TPA: 2-oxoacid:acceptor oxidoreductase family protein [Candidatus Limnocylindria bacterium]|nr:2-oxoacid:acceptor oxidoreductase family protein [Candidatus Limnocylindria bacterium]
MTREIIIAGFGGQGVMAMGKTLIEAGLAEGFEVSWVPSYGPEMRGGTANCSVVISTEPIGSPVVTQPTELIAMNGPSLARFERSVEPGGLILINSSQVEKPACRADVRCHLIPSMEEAGRLGNFKVANMVMLGAYIKATGALKLETIEKMLASVFYGPKAHLVELNVRALQAGAAYVG